MAGRGSGAPAGRGIGAGTKAFGCIQCGVTFVGEVVRGTWSRSKSGRPHLNWRAAESVAPGRGIEAGTRRLRCIECGVTFGMERSETHAGVHSQIAPSMGNTSVNLSPGIAIKMGNKSWSGAERRRRQQTTAEIALSRVDRSYRTNPNCPLVCLHLSQTMTDHADSPISTFASPSHKRRSGTTVQSAKRCSQWIRRLIMRLWLRNREGKSKRITFDRRSLEKLQTVVHYSHSVGGLSLQLKIFV
jgi:hypothetical protein